MIAQLHFEQSATINQAIHEDQSQPWHLLIEDFALNNSTLRFDDSSLSEPVRIGFGIVERESRLSVD